MIQIQKRMKYIVNKILGMKLHHRMFLLYIVGGVLPILLIGWYLISGTNKILVEQAKSTEITEMEMARKHTEELFKTVNMVSKYFIFDEKLEEIAAKNYTDYQEMVDDYKEFRSFINYGKYYNNIISWMSVYLENPTIHGNSHFVKVDEKIKEEVWYQNVLEKRGGVFWQYIQVSAKESENLVLTRLIKTKTGKNVGVLILHVRPERLLEIIKSREYDSMIILNGKDVVSDKKGNHISYEDIYEYLPEKDENTYQITITIGKEEYVMTCASISMEESNDYVQLISLRSHHDIISHADNQNRQSVYIFIFSIGISMVMILLFSISFSKRVERFRRQMQKAAAGNFELEEKLGGDDEISELYDYLGTMIWNIQKLLSEIYREKLHAERLNSEQKEAEFKMLTSQINPHFLYNTLETIRMKARINNQYEIEELVKMLAKILRKNIQAGSQDVTILSEVELIGYYLKIQQYRFGDRIQYDITVDKELEEHKILPLIIQPIVENSIIHGLESKGGIGHINILVRQIEDKISITIEDNGMGIGEEDLNRLQKDINKKNQYGTHIGIGNVHQRVRLRYGDNYGVKVSSTLGVGTKVEIRLPKEGFEKMEGDENV